MVTKIIKIDAENPEIELIREVAAIIKKGGLVAFPTETVYGLGADGTNYDAVSNIFKAKGRPQDNPLILHINDIKMATKVVSQIPEKAETLIANFMPGPLAIVLNKTGRVPDIVSGGLATVAIRMPANKIALSLIEECGVPLAAPSANESGKPSPTDATHVIDDLDGKVDCIIDGGKTNIGIESTVIDLTSEIPVLLRPGNVTLDMLESAIGIVELHDGVQEIRSPGMKYRHYSPDAKVVLADNLEEIAFYSQKYLHKKIGIISRFHPRNDNHYMYKTKEELAKDIPWKR